jgi:hypothetical protein
MHNGALTMMEKSETSNAAKQNAAKQMLKKTGRLPF